MPNQTSFATQLEPSLFASLDSAVVTLYRRNYRKFRVGSSEGAKGQAPDVTLPTGPRGLKTGLERQGYLADDVDVQQAPEFLTPPLVGFGTFNDFRDAEAVGAAASHALHSGYRFLDCAHLHGNETEVGKAIGNFLADSTTPREDLFVASKLWSWDMAPEDVEMACRGTLQDLGLTYVDCYMMHLPVQMTKDSHLVAKDDGSSSIDARLVHSGDMDKIMETYEAMEHLVDLGLVRSLGVSNFGMQRLRELLRRCRILPRAVEAEMHPYCAQPRLLDLCGTKDIQVLASSPLGNARRVVDGQPCLIEDPVVLAISDETGFSPAQVLLRWGVQRGTSVTPKSLRPSHIEANLDVLDWTLSPSQMFRLDDLDSGCRFGTFPWFDIEADSEYCKSAGRPVCQPALTPGYTDAVGAYRNDFGRDAKKLHTGIFVKRDVLKNLDTLGRQVLPECSHEAKNYLITDSVVDAIMGDQVLAGFRAAGLHVTKIVVQAAGMDEAGEPSTEPFKTAESFHHCVDEVLGGGITKNSCIISMGGGVINNICGVVAATLYRGIHLVHITTTSMGMLDASIDFKQAFNHSCGKNLIGCYYPADLIVMDPCVLQSLGPRHTLNGIAEALKHGLTQSEALVRTIVEPLREGGPAKLADGFYIEEMCKHTIETKVPTLTHYNESDFNEMVPQYGHAIAHSIEHLSWHDGRSALLHGEAVAIGMCVTAEVSRLMGLCDDETVEKHYDYVGATGLPVFVPADMTLDEVMHKMTYDKHYVKEPTMGLCRSIGIMAAKEDGSYAFGIAPDMVREALAINAARRDTAGAGGVEEFCQLAPGA